MDADREAARKERMSEPPETRGSTLKRVALGVAMGAILLASNRGRATMVPTETSRDAKPAVPPIDANRPAETETATFAMG
ncbi:MAG: hypothetical protein U9R72_13625 [Chloroflexota bacterium]|nr:hypothetical protein [Chloroflexota bacterium]